MKNFYWLVDNACYKIQEPTKTKSYCQAGNGFHWFFLLGSSLCSPSQTSAAVLAIPAMPTASAHITIHGVSPVTVDEDALLARPLLQRYEEEDGGVQDEREQHRSLPSSTSYNSTSQQAIVGANLCPIESLDYEYLLFSLNDRIHTLNASKLTVCKFSFLQFHVVIICYKQFKKKKKNT